MSLKKIFSGTLVFLLLISVAPATKVEASNLQTNQALYTSLVSLFGLDQAQAMWQGAFGLLSPTSQLGLVSASQSNIALNKSTKQSSTKDNENPSRAVDGDTAGKINTQTLKEEEPWWEVDLGASYEISDIKIFNRDDYRDRLSNYHIFISNTPFKSTTVSGTQKQSGVHDLYQKNYPDRTKNISVNKTGRYIRVQLEDKQILHMSEVEVYGELVLDASITPKTTNQATPSKSTETKVTTDATATNDGNIALNKSTKQSSTKDNENPSRAVDGDTAGKINTQTLKEEEPWWEVDLGASYEISDIKIFNRDDYRDRLSNYHIFISNTPFKSTTVSGTQKQSGVHDLYQKNYPDRTKNISVNKTGRYIRVQLEDKQILHMSEVEVYGELAGQSNQVTTVESKSVDTQTSNSTTFKTGQTVKVNTGDGSKLNVRSSANGTAVGKQADGSVGKITSGPTDKAGYTWWKVNFDSGSDGWAVEKYLKKHTVSATTASTPVTTTSKPVSNGTAKLLFLGDFETGGIQAADKYHDGWGQQLNNNPSKVTTEQVRAGKYAWKTDFNRISSYYGSNKPRSELMKTKPNMMSLDTEYWIGLSVYIPKDWKADSVHEILWQMHGADGASPPLDFRTFDDKMYLVHRYESNGKNNTDTIWQSSIERGKWIDFIINVKWSGKEDGFLNIWKNENKIYSLKGDVGFGLNGSGHTFLKIGDYKWRWFTSPTSVTRRVLYHDEIRIAEGSGGYDLVNPGSY